MLGDVLSRRRFGRRRFVCASEIQINIMLRSFKRETSDVGVTTFERHRLLAHLSITVQKIRGLRKYQGKTNSFFDTMKMIIEEDI